jgi:putative sterol carrier protein
VRVPPIAFGTQEWVEEFQTRLNDSASYRNAAATWEGALGLEFGAEPDLGWPETRYAVLDLWHGECREAGFVTAAEAEQTPFLIRAPYSRWKQVLRGQLDPIKGMMQGKLRLRGDLPTIVRHVKAAKELVHIATEIPTDFPDER